jgi:hypothetical protein
VALTGEPLLRFVLGAPAVSEAVVLVRVLAACVCARCSLTRMRVQRGAAEFYSQVALALRVTDAVLLAQPAAPASDTDPVAAAAAAAVRSFAQRVRVAAADGHDTTAVAESLACDLFDYVFRAETYLPLLALYVRAPPAACGHV